MANYYGTARTNYVTLTDIEGARKYLEPFSIRMVEKEGKHAFLDDCPDGGGWPSFGIDEDGEDIEFDFFEFMRFVAAGEVLVFMEAGAEKQRYVTGYSEAYVKREDGGVAQVSISLTDIYDRAKHKFGSDIKHPITEATY